MDTSNLKIIRKIKVNKGPSRAVLFTPGKRLYTLHPQSAAISVVDLDSMTMINTFTVGDTPAAFTFVPARPADEKHKDGIPAELITANAGSKDIMITNAEDGKIISSAPLDGTPGSMAISADMTQVFILDVQNKCVIVFNLEEMKTSKTIPLDTQDPADLRMDYKNSRIYVSLRDKNELAVINPDTFKVEMVAETGKGPGRLIVDYDYDLMWIMNERSKDVVLMDVRNRKIKQKLSLGMKPTTTAFEK
jgi:DNA-binding beta-propeller fold protein YncE